jgi:hypothetical protein
MFVYDPLCFILEERQKVGARRPVVKKDFKRAS